MKTVTAPLIQNDDDLAEALARLSEVFMAAAGTPEADEREVLADLIEAYERKHHAIAPPDPVSAIEFAMEQRKYTRSDLGKALGGLSRLSDILNRRRRLSMAQVLALHRQFQIPLESLISETAVSAAPVKRGRKAASVQLQPTSGRGSAVVGKSGADGMMLVGEGRKPLRSRKSGTENATARKKG